MIVLLALTGCLKHTFVDRPVVTVVNDRRPIETPAEREFVFAAYMADVLLTRSSPDKLKLPVPTSALDINAVGEVPDSTWFTNRDIGQMSPEEIVAGPVSAQGPPVLPLVVVNGKSSGGNPGFFAEDQTGRTFLIKWDTHENPYQQTAAAIVVSRLVWAAGYNVPSDTLIHLQPDDVSVDPSATYQDGAKEKPLTDAVLDEILASAPVIDGGVRALASEFLPGKPLGGIAVRGTRLDDPNDNVPHEHRRSLRGFKALCAWTTHSDMKEDNSLDMYRGEPGEGYVEHYLIDFGEALGGHQSEHGRKEDGFEHIADLRGTGQAFFTFGMHVRPWEKQKLTDWPEAVGMFSAEPFSPRRWREAYPYLPFRKATDADMFWGAKKLMEFDREQIEAVVAAAHYPEQGAADYMVDTLMARQEKVGQAWIAGVTSVDRFERTDQEICMTDLAVVFGLDENRSLEFRTDGGWSSVEVQDDGQVCVPAAPNGYRKVDLRSVQNGKTLNTIELHHDARRIRGVLRD